MERVKEDGAVAVWKERNDGDLQGHRPPKLGGCSLSGNGVGMTGGVLIAARYGGVNFMNRTSLYGNGEELIAQTVSWRKEVRRP